VIRMSAALEQASEHPLANAVVTAARRRGLTLSRVDGFRSVAGRGVEGIVDGVPVVIGNPAMLRELRVADDAAEATADEMRRRGETVIYIAIDGRLAALLGIADPIKATTAAAIGALRAEGVRIVMLTGDNEITARNVAQTLQLSEVLADVAPEGKRDVIRRLRAEGRIVAMAGDGVNDAPALAEADVGIAMGSGTDIAMQSADITLVKGDLRGIVRARRLSRATMRNIRQNLFLAFVYNALGVPVAAGILYPVLGTLVSPIWASAAMTLSSVSVIANALRLRRVDL
jgi:Cu+-exporting ATPase